MTKTTIFDYTVKLGIVTAGSYANITISREKQVQFAPFNILYVVNDSSETIDLLFDGDSQRKKTIAPKSTLSIDDQNFTTLVAQNTSGTDTSANEVIVTIQKVV